MDFVTEPVVLMILDGWGIAEPGPGNAVIQAKTPTLDRLFMENPHATLACSGEAVGLPAGQQGNSEVGHLNLGAGRVVYQDLLRIERDVTSGAFKENHAFRSLMMNLKNSGKSLHLMGLLSDGGVHSHQKHLYALLEMAKEIGLDAVYIHAFMDGRDVPPDSGSQYIDALNKKCEDIGCGDIATVSGRYYAMDRDKRWERVEKAWRAMVLGEGKTASSASEAISQSYADDIYDEFIEPTVIVDSSGKPFASMQDGDGVVFFNFRADRAREISYALAYDGFTDFARPRMPKLKLVTMTEYEAGMDDWLDIAYPPLHPVNTLGEWLAKHDKSQLRTAETEKYAHVTFFFNGGVEAPNKGEERILVPSPKVATYDLQPEMSAAEVADKVVDGILSRKYDFILVNFANPDMVGHTGILKAAITAMEAVDAAIARIIAALSETTGSMLICADHGNCERMIDEDGHPVTSHTTNRVPLLLVQGGNVSLRDGALCDVAPTVLELMNMEQPGEMNGKSLLLKN